ncbi:transcriptional regulator, LuxR family [Desulfatibacillum aliphaticivorans]|uniref:Transcriptional regulator, LuxR family n=2 Tax=Desulfatibacillum aliphaticivorans TaxID=218208 RepID=B8FLG3_DESAL|nr:transcriptional regulator, LuxR family [Desulfatibacillum aliphaticivorans]
MLVQGFTDFKLVPPPRRMSRPAWNAMFNLDQDVSGLFPYINRIKEDSLYFERPHYIHFHWGEEDWDKPDCALYPKKGESGCALYPKRAVIGLYKDRDEALAAAWKLVDFLNDLEARKDTIIPNHRMYKHIPVLDIFKILPRTNCRKCGYPTCMAFAAAVSAHKTGPDQCPDLTQPIASTVVYPVFDKQGKVVSTVEIETPPQDRASQGNAEPAEADDPVQAPFGETLTTREIQVLRLMAEGFTNGEISDMLEISPHTVKSHVIHVFNKLGVNDRTQAAVWAAKNNLV